MIRYLAQHDHIETAEDLLHVKRMYGQLVRFLVHRPQRKVIAIGTYDAVEELVELLNNKELFCYPCTYSFYHKIIGAAFLTPKLYFQPCIITDYPLKKVGEYPRLKRRLVSGFEVRRIDDAYTGPMSYSGIPPFPATHALHKIL